ncbi:MAG: DUF2306 domain-containing protein [Bacteroidota bacterium]
MVSDFQINQASKSLRKSARLLQNSKKLLFGIGVTGQWLFVIYIVALYGGIWLSGNYEAVNDHLPHGVIEGDTMGNLALGIHLFIAAIITFGGPLQFIPFIRNRYPAFHRWLGRTYFLIAFLAAGSGLYMIITRGAHGGWINALGNWLNALLIMIFSILAWRTAMQRDFKSHRKWAIRAFVMVSGVWFFRIGYGLWLLLTGFSGIGITADLTGPFDRFLSFGHSIIPLMILECYFWAKSQQNPVVKQRIAYLLGILAIFLAAGIAMVSMVFWWPALS